MSAGVPVLRRHELAARFPLNPRWAWSRAGIAGRIPEGWRAGSKQTVRCANSAETAKFQFALPSDPEWAVIAASSLLSNRDVSVPPAHRGDRRPLSARRGHFQLRRGGALLVLQDQALRGVPAP